jgi:hypothetical protein
MILFSHVHLGEFPPQSTIPTATQRRPDWLRPRNKPPPSSVDVIPSGHHDHIEIRIISTFHIILPHKLN